MNLYLVSFKTSKFAYYVWANNHSWAVREVEKARPELKDTEVENCILVEAKQGIMNVVLKDDAIPAKIPTYYHSKP